MKLLRYIDKYVKTYWGSWTNTGVQVVTADNRHNLKNMRVLIPSFGRLFDERKVTNNSNEQIKYNFKSNFTLFWNNLNQQHDLFSNKYYENEIDSVYSFIKIFSDFATRELIKSFPRLDKSTTKEFDYNDLKTLISNLLKEIFTQ